MRTSAKRWRTKGAGRRWGSCSFSSSQLASLGNAVPQSPWDLTLWSLKRQGHASLPKFKGIRCLLGSPWSRSRLPQTLFPHRVASPPLSGHGDRGIRPSLLARPVLKTTNCPLLLTTAVRFCSHRDTKGSKGSKGSKGPIGLLRPVRRSSRQGQ